MEQRPALLPLPEGALQPTQSLFWKVLALVLVTAVFAAISIAIYFRYILRDAYDIFLREQIGSYVQMVVDEVRTPPDTIVARAITERYPIDIGVEGPGGRIWANDTGLTSVTTIIEKTQPGFFDRGDSLLFRNFNERFYGVVQRGDWRFTIRLRSKPEEGSKFTPTIALGLVLLILFTAAYVAVQRFLLPVRELMIGVQAVANEDFKHVVPTASKDELGQLTKAFNAMTQRVAAIIASKRRLLFDVSHELRSPLTRMNVALAMLPEGKAKISIERNIRELNTMITELLENERLAVLGGTLVVDQIDVVALIRKVVDTFGYDQRRIEFDTLTGELEITADSQRFIVATRNLISNALKYSSQNEGMVKITLFPDDNGARIIVADQGIGIPPEQQARVFEPFYRTDDSRSRATGGYGLGLSLTKSIVEAHGGTIKLESTPGVGTTIMMWFPHTPAANATVRTQNDPQELRGKKTP
jgi:signal transduction histidine kinase